MSVETTRVSTVRRDTTAAGVMDYLHTRRELSTFLALLEERHVSVTGCTVFAPTNRAFQRLFGLNVMHVVTREMMDNMVVEAEIPPVQVVETGFHELYTTRGGGDVEVKNTADKVVVTDTRSHSSSIVQATDTRDGVVYVIDGVLMNTAFSI